MWGIYDTFEKYAVQQHPDPNKLIEGNVSSQSAESLRQKVVNDYKTTGKNSEKPTIPLYTSTIKDINRTISNAKCEMMIDTTVHGSFTRAYGQYRDITSPTDTYFEGSMLMKKASDFPLCASGISKDSYTSTMLTPTQILGIGSCRTTDNKVLYPGIPNDCIDLCTSIG